VRILVRILAMIIVRILARIIVRISLLWKSLRGPSRRSLWGSARGSSRRPLQRFLLALSPLW
jgi:hypothetical protein